MREDESYMGYFFKVKPLFPAVEILIAQLSQAGFDSFVETDDGLEAYILKKEAVADLKSIIPILHSKEFEITWNTREIEKINWNARWESDFESISIGTECTVRAPFHEKSGSTYDLVISPKMSFGTGHHATTYMMIKLMLNMDFPGKTVLDMGSGTAVLSILAEKMGANSIDAVDIDHWCYINGIENTRLNSCSKINVIEGDSGFIENRNYDIILANINRNILLNDMNRYVKALNKGGILLMSGFYIDDSEQIIEACTSKMLKLFKKEERDKWVALKFIN